MPAKFRKSLSFCNAIGVPCHVFTFQNTLRGLTAPSGSWLCYSNRYEVDWEAFHAIGLVRGNAPELVNFTEPRGIVCLLKYDWQHFLRHTLHQAWGGQPEDQIRQLQQRSSEGSPALEAAARRRTEKGTSAETCESLHIPLIQSALTSVSLLKCVIYEKFTGQQQPPCGRLITGTTKACLCFTKM